MIKTKEFLLNCNYYDEKTIDTMINDFIKTHNIDDIIDIKYVSNGLGGTAEMYVRALLIYKEKGE